MWKTVTLLDVAKAANVSKSTVANAFSRPQSVRAELLARIEAAARDLGYAGPDPKGRMLSLGKVNAIGARAPQETRGIGFPLEADTRHKTDEADTLPFAVGDVRRAMAKGRDFL